MNIIEQSREFDKVEMYLMTLGNQSISVKDIDDGTVLDVDGWILYSMEKNGDEIELLSILTKDKKVYVTQSVTFKRSFHDISLVMEDDPYSVIKTSGASKAGRPFVDCTLKID